MRGDVAADVPPEARAFFAGVAKVEAGEGPREHHVLDRIVEPLVLARRAGDPTVEREGDVMTALYASWKLPARACPGKIGYSR
jgi:hypothetical protein